MEQHVLMEQGAETLPSVRDSEYWTKLSMTALFVYKYALCYHLEALMS